MGLYLNCLGHGIRQLLRWTPMYCQRPMRTKWPIYFSWNSLLYGCRLIFSLRIGSALLLRENAPDVGSYRIRPHRLIVPSVDRSNSDQASPREFDQGATSAAIFIHRTCVKLSLKYLLPNPEN